MGRTAGTPGGRAGGGEGEAHSGQRAAQRVERQAAQQQEKNGSAEGISAQPQSAGRWRLLLLPLLSSGAAAGPQRSQRAAVVCS